MTEKLCKVSWLASYTKGGQKTCDFPLCCQLLHRFWFCFTSWSLEKREAISFDSVRNRSRTIINHFCNIFLILRFSKTSIDLCNCRNNRVVCSRGSSRQGVQDNHLQKDYIAHITSIKLLLTCCFILVWVANPCKVEDVVFLFTDSNSHNLQSLGHRLAVVA